MNFFCLCYCVLNVNAWLHTRVLKINKDESKNITDEDYSSPGSQVARVWLFESIHKERRWKRCSKELRVIHRLIKFLIGEVKKRCYYYHSISVCITYYLLYSWRIFAVPGKLWNFEIDISKPENYSKSPGLASGGISFSSFTYKFNVYV